MSTNILLHYLLEQTSVSSTSSEVNDCARSEVVVDQVNEGNDPLLQIKIVDVKSNVQFDENYEAGKELKNVIKHERSELDRTESCLPTEKLLLGDNEIQNEQCHPVTTWKSPRQYGCLDTKSVSAKDNVTILDNVASITALKRLWAKTCQPAKMVAKRDTENSVETKANLNLRNGFCRNVTNEDLKPGYHSCHTNHIPVVREPIHDFSNARNAKLNLSSVKSSVKPCKVKLKRLNNLAHPYRHVHSDSTNVDRSPCSEYSVMKKTNCTVTKRVDRTIGLYNCIKFPMNTSQSTVVAPREILSKDNNGRDPVLVRTNSSPMSVERHTLNGSSNENACEVNDNSGNSVYDRLDSNVPCERTIMQDLPNFKEIIGNVDTDFLSDHENDKDDQIEHGVKKKIDLYHNESDIILEEGTCLKPDYDAPANESKRRGRGRPPILGNYHCVVCPFMAKEKSLVKQHQNTMHRIVPPCLQCKKRFKSWSFYLRHMAYIHGAERSSLCDINCSNFTNNEIQQTTQEPVREPDLKPICQICGCVKNSLRDLRHHHAVKHGKRFQCMICGFRVKSNSELKSHLLVHSDERPFKCTYPECTFGGSKTRSDLTKHERVHKKIVRKIDS